MSKGDGAGLSDHVFRRLIDLGSDVFALVGSDFRLLYVSPAYEELSGRKPEEVIGEPISEFIDPTDLDRHRTNLGSIRSNPGEQLRFDARFRHLDGSWRYIEATVQNLFHDPTIAAMAVNVRDITKRKQMEEALAESESRFRLLADNALDIIARYRIQPNPGLEYISPSVERVTGYSPQEHYADPGLALKIIHPEDRERFGAFLANFLDVVGTPHTFRWIHKDGHSIWLEQLNVLIRDDEGKVVAADSISRDVTEKVTLERQLLQAQKLEAVGRLAGGIAHDFNNLLTVILGQVGILKLGLPGNEQVESSADVIRETAERAAALTRQLLSFSRRGLVRERDIGLSEAIVGLEGMLRRMIPTSVALRTRLDSRLAIRIDPSQLEQVVVNLVVNAKEAMTDGGEIAIETEDDGDIVRLRVRDDGAGIDDDSLSKIFEPFFSTKEESGGSGLGLSVVHGIVKQSGGDIEVSSRAGEGTVFTITWRARPVPDDAGPSMATPTAALGQSARNARLLLVEDEDTLRDAVADILRGNGYEVVESANGEEALALWEREERPIDLLITDMVMPRLGGRALADQLLHRQPTLKVLFVSGYPAADADRSEASRGDSAFMAKPFDIDEFLAKVSELLAGAPVAESI